MKGIASIPVGVARTNSVVVTREMTVAHFQEHMPLFTHPIMIYHMEVAAAE